MNRRPAVIKTVLAWVGIAIGIIFLIGSLTDGNVLAGILIGLAFIAPGAWWLRCNKQDKTASEPTKRRWGTVATASVVALIAGSMALPASDTTAETTSVSTTTSTTSSATTTSRASTTRSTEPTTSTTRSSTTTTRSATRSTTSKSSATTTSEAPSVRQGFVDIPDDPEPAPVPVIEQPPAPAPVPAPAPIVQEAPAPVGPTIYSTCADAKRAGAGPFYIGDPNYDASRDRDGDGVLCE